MSLALLTRGYVCVGHQGVAVYGAGPGIVSAEAVVPELRGAALKPTPTPTIIGGGVGTPSIAGAAGGSEAPAGDTPTILSAGDTVPNIDGSEKG